MGVAESLSLGTEEGGPTVLLAYSRFGPSRTRFLRSQALSVETSKVTFVPGPVIIDISVESLISSQSREID